MEGLSEPIKLLQNDTANPQGRRLNILRATKPSLMSASFGEKGLQPGHLIIQH